MAYRIIPNRSTGCLDKSLEGGYIRFREPGATVTNIIYKRNRPSKLGGASIRRGAFIGDNTVYICVHYTHDSLHHSLQGQPRDPDYKRDYWDDYEAEALAPNLNGFPEEEATRPQRITRSQSESSPPQRGKKSRGSSRFSRFTRSQSEPLSPKSERKERGSNSSSSPKRQSSFFKKGKKVHPKETDPQGYNLPKENQIGSKWRPPSFKRQPKPNPTRSKRSSGSSYDQEIDIEYSPSPERQNPPNSVPKKTRFSPVQQRKISSAYEAQIQNSPFQDRKYPEQARNRLQSDDSGAIPYPATPPRQHSPQNRTPLKEQIKNAGYPVPNQLEQKPNYYAYSSPPSSRRTPVRETPKPVPRTRFNPSPVRSVGSEGEPVEETYIQPVRAKPRHTSAANYYNQLDLTAKQPNQNTNKRTPERKSRMDTSEASEPYSRSRRTASESSEQQVNIEYDTSLFLACNYTVVISTQLSVSVKITHSVEHGPPAFSLTYVKNAVRYLKQKCIPGKSEF